MLKNMTNFSQTVKDFRAYRGYTFREMAKVLTDALSDRPYPPKSVSHNTIVLWENGEVDMPDASRFEWIATHAEDVGLRVFATRVLQSLDGS